jgi:3-hydroxyacyl-CoA dehydrogenase
MSDTVTLEIVDNVAVIEIANPPVNGLGDTTRKGLSDALAQAFADDAVTGVAITGSGRGFSGGADVRQFNTPAASAEPGLRTIFAQITAAEKPVVAAIHGFALGGGLELALACHYRIAQEGASIGLSEVNLGLIPGGGGTQRLPRLIGANKALQLIRKGASVDATKAKDLGIVDAVFTGDPAEAARTFITDKASSTQDHPVLDELPTAAADGADFDVARAEAKKNRRNGRAELAAIDAVEKSLGLPIEAGLDAERALFSELIDGSESKALRYLFFAERMTPKLASVPKDTPIRDIKTAGVIGSGTMGVGIAISLANAGISVTLIDKSAEALEKATERIAGIYESSAKKGRVTAAEAEENRNRIVTATDYSSLNDVDLIIEAVFEDLEVKREVFKEISQLTRPDTILATNTSRLDVNKIADVTTKPENVIGLHFFSPAHVMRLLEVVQADRTSDEVLASSMKLGQRIGKQPVLSQVCDGFIGNRMLSPYRRETDLLLEAGATPQQVDGALTDFGMAMGPFAVSDLAGLDIGEAGRETFRQTADPVLLESDSEISTILVEAGRHGQKTGAGYYRYEEGNRTPQPDPYVDEVIAQAAAKKGVQRREVSNEEIVERSMLALINEGAKLLDEGIAQRASDIDVVWTSGYGFPAYRGGPMYYATTLGLEQVVAKMREFQQNIGEYWKPADLLERLVKAGKEDFSDLSV